MTTPWNITPDWAGKTVAVLGAGPSMSKEIGAQLATFKRIVVNYTFQAVPDADMLVALDLDVDFWQAAKDFSGLRVCGVASQDLDALYAGPMFERVDLAPGHLIDIRNSGLAAIRIAAAMGASRIILAGFDPEVRGHFDGYPSTSMGQTADGEPYIGLTRGLAALIDELRAAGVVIERYAGAPIQPSPQTPDPVEPAAGAIE